MRPAGHTTPAGRMAFAMALARVGTTGDRAQRAGGAKLCTSPPSTGRQMPLMYRDSSEAKNTAAFATSMAVPICPVGDSASRAATIAPTDSYAPLMPFIVHAAVRTLQRFPKVNATIDLDAGVIRCADGERIGIAVDTPRGLLVPVIKDGGGLGVGRLAAVIGELGTKARDGGLTLADLAGGSFTVTNYGSVGTFSTHRSSTCRRLRSSAPARSFAVRSSSAMHSRANRSTSAT